MTDHAHELRRHARKIGHPSGDIPAVMQAAAAHIEKIERHLHGLEWDVTHWRANHAAEVLRARVLKERPDMPLERVEAYKQIGELLARVAELEAQVKALEWQPIETAPADTIVLLAGEIDSPGDWRIKCGYRDDTTRSGWKIWGASWEPSLWMPLPQPPKNEP